jgi:hypothetical protein
MQVLLLLTNQQHSACITVLLVNTHVMYPVLRWQASVWPPLILVSFNALIFICAQVRSSYFLQNFARQSDGFIKVSSSLSLVQQLYPAALQDVLFQLLRILHSAILRTSRHFYWVLSICFDNQFSFGFLWISLFAEKRPLRFIIFTWCAVIASTLGNLRSSMRFNCLFLLTTGNAWLYNTPKPTPLYSEINYSLHN